MGAPSFNVGTIECLALDDGTHCWPAEAIFVNAERETAEGALNEHGLDPDAIPLAYTGMLVKTAGRLVLIDGGIDPGVFPAAGRLLESLSAEGVRPDDVDTVILTHCHPDHITGLVDQDGSPTFPNARVLVNQTEWEFWTSEANLRKFDAGEVYGVPDFDQIMSSSARRILTPIRDRVEPVRGETELAPGVHALPAPGHTPGHMALIISSGDEQLLHLGDAVIHPIHLEHPEWRPMMDMPHLIDAAATTRRRLLDRAASEDALVAIYHFPFPGVGHIRRSGRGWRWDPTNTTPALNGGSAPTASIGSTPAERWAAEGS